MELSALEAALASDLDDDALWAVYADARSVRDAADPWAAEIRAALAGEDRIPPEGDPIWGPLWPGIRVVWHRGFWRHLALLDEPEVDLGEVLAHPSARLLQSLYCEADRLDPAALAGAPLRRLRVSGRLESLAQVADALPALTSLVVEGTLDVAGQRAPRIREVAASDVSGVPDLALAGLTSLTLDRKVAEGIETIDVEAVPNLRTLALRPGVTDALLRQILSSPMGRRLTHLEVGRRGSSTVDLGSVASQWAHLDRLVVDVSHAGAEQIPVEHGALRYRSVDFDPGGPYVRLRPVRLPPSPRLVAAAQAQGLPLQAPPPATDLRQAIAFQETVADLGMAATIHLPLGAALFSVPARWARSFVRRMAVRGGATAELYDVHQALDRVGGRVVRMELSVQGTAYDPDGTQSPVENVLTAIRYVSEAEEDDGEDPGIDVDNEIEGVYQMIWERLEGPITDDPLSVPIHWHPDPLDLAPLPQVGIVALRIGDTVHRMAEAHGTYLAWRAEAAGILDAAPAPDLGRWTRRLLRRHDLDRDPPDDHPYWAEWSRLTLDDRTGRSPGPSRIPGFKIRCAGRWPLDDDEARILARGLRQILPHHRPDPDAAEQVRILADLLDAGSAEIVVRR